VLSDDIFLAWIATFYVAAPLLHHFYIQCLNGSIAL
jgi:hypothetical protein